jgi:hypothetical protein
MPHFPVCSQHGGHFSTVTAFLFLVADDFQLHLAISNGFTFKWWVSRHQSRIARHNVRKPSPLAKRKQPLEYVMLGFVAVLLAKKLDKLGKVVGMGKIV